MDLLILGGNAFLGRAVAQTAVDAGHRVTCAARGTTSFPSGVRSVRLDRDEPDAHYELNDRTWDAIVDVTRQPGHARAAAQTLNTRHCVFVSSASAYAPSAHPFRDETADILPPLDGDSLTDMSLYGQAKVACENAYLEESDNVAILRAGLIGGFGDDSGRSGYYPWRFAHPTGDDVLVPDDLGFPCALIDVDDLAAWIVLLAERRTTGIFNAAGHPFTLAEAVSTSKEVAGSSVQARPVPLDILRDAGVSAWMGPRSLPLWIDDVDMRHFAVLDNRRALAAGLSLRPLADTFADALRFENQRDHRSCGLSDDEERELRRTLDAENPKATKDR